MASLKLTSNGYLSRTGATTRTAGTICGWVRAEADNNMGLLSVVDGSLRAVGIQRYLGNFCPVGNGGTGGNIIACALNTWYYVAVTFSNGSNAVGYASSDGGANFSSVAVTNPTGMVNFSGWGVGTDYTLYNSESTCLRYVRVFDKVLSTSELYSEAQSATLVLTANGIASYALSDSSTYTDLIGGDDNMTLGGGSAGTTSSEPTIGGGASVVPQIARYYQTLRNA